MGIPHSGAQQETEWIHRAQKGDRDAFGDLVTRHLRRVSSIVFHLVRRRDDIEDITQEIFLKAFLAVRGYDFRSSFSTWLARIAVNHCYDYLRRERSSRVTYASQMSEEQWKAIEARVENTGLAALDSEQSALLREFAAKLLARAPADDRVVLALKELEELSVEEIAEILNLNISTVKVRLHRARKRMLKDLEELERGR